jgi:phosphoglycerate-specific signal transduction histidine kinase
MREDNHSLRTEMRENNQELRGEIHGLRTEVNARLDRVTNIMIGGIIAVVGAVTASIVVNLINS